jgi:hypothetical protein
MAFGESGFFYLLNLKEGAVLREVAMICMSVEEEHGKIIKCE